MNDPNEQPQSPIPAPAHIHARSRAVRTRRPLVDRDGKTVVLRERLMPRSVYVASATLDAGHVLVLVNEAYRAERAAILARFGVRPAE